ncbi:uncharacterized protein [Venturia canescens]|uniref:uncharacterized protein n=1 Tax=Venturia canescens TaxID=32260 RepID=UPI001C9CE32E|nr:uncharacterized protein LOC122407299 [Venturia canescens]
MKFLAIFLAIPILAVSGALTPQDVMRFGSARQRCSNEYTVDPTSIERARAGERVNDPEFDCFVACILQGMDLMGSDGSLDTNAAIDKVPNAPFHDALVAAISSCSNERGKNNCDTARRLIACIQDKGVLAGPGRGPDHAAWAKCMEESGLEKESFRNTPPDDPKKKCFDACLMKHHGHLKEDGTVDVEKMIADLPPDVEDRERISGAITECAANKNDDQCETAYLIRNCLIEKDAIPFPGKMMKMMKKCMAENGIEDFKDLQSGDQKTKCFGACMMKEKGILNEDGTVDTEKAVASLPPDVPDRDRIAEAITECSAKKGADDCETAGLIWDCLQEKDALPPMPHHGHHHRHHGP